MLCLSRIQPCLGWVLPKSCIGRRSAFGGVRSICSKGDNVANAPCSGRSEYLYYPGAKSVYVHTFGCSHNMSDGEYMKGLLAKGGYNIISRKEEADVWVINTCTVRDKSIQSFQSLYQQAKKNGSAVVIAGCMTSADPDMRKKYANDGIVGVTDIGNIKEVVDSLLVQHQPLHRVKISDMPPLNLPKVRKDPSVEIIPISLGCNGACTFCQTKIARGNLRSYPLPDILSRIRQVCKEGVSEIWLTSEDTGAYGSDCGSSFSELLQGVQQCIEGTNVMVKVGMTNPPYMQACLPSLVNAMKHPQVYSYLHIPVQSGSDFILRKMNRKYTISEFEHIAQSLLTTVPGITLSTDIIVGFPYESDNDFDLTMKLLQRLGLDIVHYSRYYARPHTVAARYPQLPLSVVKPRVKILSDWFKGLNPYERLKGKVMLVWVSGEVEGDCRCCHTKNYIKVCAVLGWGGGRKVVVGNTRVVIPNEQQFLPGDMLLVQCTEATRFHIAGHVVERVKSIKKNSIVPDDLVADSIESLQTILSF